MREKTTREALAKEVVEFYCPYCRLWITDNIHRQHHHNDLDDPDDIRRHEIRVDGKIYEDEVELMRVVDARKAKKRQSRKDDHPWLDSGDLFGTDEGQ